jgi:hypothetical protein
MDLRKLVKVCGLALGIAALGLWTACSSDDEVKYVEFGDGLESGVTVTMEGNLYELNVKSNGAWQASLSEKCDWAALIKDSGKGDGNIQILVEDNLTGVTRYTDLTLTVGNETKTVRLTQMDTLDGVALNDGEDVEYLSTIKSKKLGYGCNAVEFYDDASKNKLKFTVNVFNISAINSLVKSDDMYGDLITSNPAPSIDYQSANVDTIVSKEDSLGVSLSMSIAYGTIKFGVSGRYSGFENYDSSLKVIHIGADYPSLDATLSYADAVQIYDDWVDEGKPKEDLRRGALAMGFAAARNELKALCNDANAAEADKMEKADEIISKFGTGITTSSKLGGMIAMDLYYDSLKIEEVMRIDTAKITADINMGLFSLKGKVEVSYKNEATTIMQNSSHKVEMKGGSTDKMSEVIRQFENNASNDVLNSAIKDWTASLSNGDDGKSGNVALLTAEVVPIWNLFDSKSAKVIKACIKKKYPKSKFVQDFIKDETEQKTK